MHQANRLAGTRGHYRVRKQAVRGQDREREGAQELTYRDTGRQEVMQEGQSPACTNRF